MSSSDKHWTILLQVEEVIPKEVIRDGGGRPQLLTGGQNVATTERRVIERFKAVVAADSEPEAYRKAIALLEINQPEPVFSNRPAPEPEHLHRASCDDSGGNLICGFPPGKSIAF